MPDSQFNINFEKSINEKLKDLGYLCYNMSIDNKNIFLEFNNNVYNMQNCMNYINKLRRADANLYEINKYLKRLDYEAEQLGLLCFNLYIDKKLYTNKLIDVCTSIMELNMKMFGNCDYQENNFDLSEYDEEMMEFEEDFDYEEVEFKLDIPSGYEPIPINAKICPCGYRNREYAKYCGKCGAKLNRRL